MGLRFKEANVTHPELKTTFKLPILSVKKNPQSNTYTSLGVITKGKDMKYFRISIGSKCFGTGAGNTDRESSLVQVRAGDEQSRIGWVYQFNSACMRSCILLIIS